MLNLLVLSVILYYHYVFCLDAYSSHLKAYHASPGSVVCFSVLLFHVLFEYPPSAFAASGRCLQTVTIPPYTDSIGLR